MKIVRNFLFASYLNFKVSLQMNPIITSLLSAVTVVFLYSVLKMFGL